MLAQNGVVLSTVYVLAALGGAGTVIAYLFRALVSSKDALIASKEKEAAADLAEKNRIITELDSVKKSYQEVAAEALKSAIETTNYYRQKEGKPPLIPVAPVVSESHSPSTAEQREAALIATMRASMAQVKLITGQEPRPEPPRAADDKVDLPKPDPKTLAVATPQSALTTTDAIRVIEAMEDAVQQVPEKTAERVIDKLKEQEE